MGRQLYGQVDCSAQRALPIQAGRRGHAATDVVERSGPYGCGAIVVATAKRGRGADDLQRRQRIKLSRQSMRARDLARAESRDGSYIAIVLELRSFVVAGSLRNLKGDGL